MPLTQGMKPSPFHNPLAIPNTNPDPERTKKMAAEERSLRRDFKSFRRVLAADCAEKGYFDNEIWSWRYTDYVEKVLDSAAFSWRSYKAFYRDTEGTDEWKRVEHAHRRTIAICDEEIALHNQGMDVAMAAHHFNKTVASGCW